MSQLEVDKIIPQSGTTLTIGDSGDTVNFADGTSIGIDTNTLYVDSTNNRVGIGTTSPSQKLEVSGTIHSSLSATNYSFGTTTSGGGGFFIEPDDYTASNPTWEIRTFLNEPLAFQIGGFERMRIDSSGRLIVNDTNPIFTNAKIQAVNSSGPTLGIKQTTGTQSAGGFWNSSTDASVKVISVYKGTSGNEVGIIGVTNNDNLYIQGDATDSGLQCGTNTILPVQNGVNADNTIDLGASTIRWKDLYLGGGLYVGGTGTANKLDDYEEGTFTPSIGASGTAHSGVTFDERYGRYTKIGRLVYAEIWFNLASISTKGTGTQLVTGLPFTVDSTNPGYVSASIGYCNNFASTNAPGAAYALYNTTSIYLRKYASSDARDNISGVVSASAMTGTEEMMISVVYQTN